MYGFLCGGVLWCSKEVPGVVEGALALLLALLLGLDAARLLKVSQGWWLCLAGRCVRLPLW